MNWLNLIAFITISLTLVSSNFGKVVPENSDVDLENLEKWRAKRDYDEDIEERQVVEGTGDDVADYLKVFDKGADTCGSMPKKTFNDIDYSLLGYDVMHGYPMALGRDPGFRKPIFLASYDSVRYNPDCRYLVPKGLDIIHDVSCDTSFTSKEIKSHHDFHKAMSFSAHVEGSGWGASFSASAGYKKSRDTVKDGQSVIIVSEAICKYFYTRLDPITAPPLHPTFIAHLIKLQAANGFSEEYEAFIKNYGTHFMEEINYGARYVFQHKMSLSNYKTASKKSYSVSAQASYSGIVSVSGGFSLESDQQQHASEFSKMVETTTVTVGATPPANGDAMTWASSVKDNPMPMEYKLKPIYELFTPKYMSGTGLTSTQVNIMLNYMVIYLGRYCERLRSTGKVTSCTAPVSNPNLGVHKYKVMFITGTDTYAGSTGKVSVTLYGNLGTCGPIELTSVTLETKQSTEETIACDSSVGTISKINTKIGNNNGWQLFSASVQDMTKGDIYRFQCYCWMDGNAGKNNQDMNAEQ